MYYVRNMVYCFQDRTKHIVNNFFGNYLVSVIAEKFKPLNSFAYTIRSVRYITCLQYLYFYILAFFFCSILNYQVLNFQYQLNLRIQFTINVHCIVC